MERRSVVIPEDLWERAGRASRKAAMLEDQNVSRSELIRRGLREQCKKIEEER